MIPKHSTETNAYFDAINTAMDAPAGELDEDALAQVAGGIGVEATLAIITFAYGAG